eukprot:1671743-Pyramimonas_sp.AAC.1
MARWRAKRVSDKKPAGRAAPAPLRGPRSGILAATCLHSRRVPRSVSLLAASARAWGLAAGLSQPPWSSFEARVSKLASSPGETHRAYQIAKQRELRVTRDRFPAIFPE